MRYAFIGTAQGRHRVGRLCQVLRVSRSGYYAWRTRPASARSQANGQLLDAMRSLHAQTKERYGAVKLWHALHAAGIRCGRHRVARLRRRHGMTARRVRRFRIMVEHHQLPPPAPNRLKAVGPLAARDRVWAGDLTTIATRAGWLYLAVVLDLYSRRIVGWAMGTKPGHRAHHGRGPAPAVAGADSSHGPGAAVREPGVPPAAGAAGAHGEHEPQGPVRRQRDGRELLQYAEERTGP